MKYKSLPRGNFEIYINGCHKTSDMYRQN
jgi:hypothetical protein